MANGVESLVLEEARSKHNKCNIRKSNFLSGLLAGDGSRRIEELTLCPDLDNPTHSACRNYIGTAFRFSKIVPPQFFKNFLPARSRSVHPSPPGRRIHAWTAVSRRSGSWSFAIPKNRNEAARNLGLRWGGWAGGPLHSEGVCSAISVFETGA